MKKVVVAIVVLLLLTGWALYFQVKSHKRVEEAEVVVEVEMSDSAELAPTTLAEDVGHKDIAQLADPEEIGADVLLVAGKCPVIDRRNYEKRITACHGLNRNLNNSERVLLYSVLKAHVAAQNDLPPMAFQSLRNEILDALIEQEEPPDDLGVLMADLAEDSSQDRVWRNYCAQHFTPYYRVRWRRGEQDLHDADRQRLIDAFWTAAQTHDEDVCGAALIGLERLSRDYSEFERGRIGQVALGVLTDTNAIDTAQVTALQVCGLVGETNVLSIAREMVVEEQTPVAICIPAIYAIGLVGDDTDLVLLESVEGRRDVYRAAVGNARNNLAKKRR